MADETTIAPPEAPQEVPQQQPATGADQPIATPSKSLYDQLNKTQLYTKSYEEFQQQFSSPQAIDKLYQNLNRAQLYTKDKQQFYDQFFPGSRTNPSWPSGPTAQPQQPSVVQPEHQISHTNVQDARHLYELAHQPVTKRVVDPQGGLTEDDPDDLARNKRYQDLYEQAAAGLAQDWGVDTKAAKRAVEDFPGEPDEQKLKGFAGLAQNNPVYYGRLKSANDIRMAIASSGTDGINDANIFNHLQTSGSYEQLQDNIALQQEIMHKHGLGQQYFEKLKESQAPLINTLDPGLLTQYWNSEDKKLGLSDFQYAGLETEKMFNPGKYQQDIAILRHNKGLDEPAGETHPASKKGYAYDRGVENVLYALENQGRENTGNFVQQRNLEVGPQIDALKKQYQDAINVTSDPAEQQRLLQEFQQHPLLQEAARLDEGQQSIDYARTEDQRRFPLNYSDKASRLVKDAMSQQAGVLGTAAVAGKQVLLGAGETSDNTLRFIKNTAINLFGSGQLKAENAASNIGHEALTTLSGYEGSAFSTQEQPLIIGDGLAKGVQAILNDDHLSAAEKNQKAGALVLNSPDQIKLNPKAGQQNLTGKSVLYSAANSVGQILGIADQSFLLGGLIGNASKAQQMASALTPMYMSTQNHLYEQSLARGDEHPLLSSHLDAAIISLASLINPDAKIVKGMIGEETALGKMLAGVDESTWNKVIADNPTLMARMIAGTKATAKQLGLANLQYGLIVPTAQYLVHKNVLNEDPNLGDAIKDGMIQASISMAIPALFHGVWGGINVENVNPTQKYALVEAGLHPKEHIDLIDQQVEKGQVTPDRAAQIKEVIRQTGHILEHTEAVKSDGSWMNEQEVADLAFQMVRKKILETKLKNAPDPQKPAIEAKINEIDQSVADLHTSQTDKQKTALNELLTNNMGRIRANIPTMESPVLEAIKRNEPEQVFKMIYDQAVETKTVEGKEISARAATEETFGKALVDKAFELHKSKPESHSQARDLGLAAGKPQEGAPAASSATREPAAPSLIEPAAERVQPTEAFRTWNLGDMEGKPENEAAKKHIEGVVRAWDQHPAGETGGETFGSFVGRVIPAFERALQEDPNNTTIVTHSSVLKAMRVWQEMGRPEVERLTEEQKKQFADRYNEAETHNGDLETFRGNNGDIHVIRHGQTEDNAKNNFRSGNTNLTEKGVQDAQVAGQELKAKTAGDVPMIITSDLPRTVHTSNIIHDALRESGPAGEVPRAGTTGEDIPAGSQGMGSGQQGEAPPGQGGSEGQIPPPEAGGQAVADTEDGERRVGVHHDALTDLALKLGLKEPERGTVLTPKEYAVRGRIMIAGGADPEKVARTFQRTKNVNPDVISVARAHFEELVRSADKIGDEQGHESQPYKDALSAVQRWQDEVLKPMGTRAGETFTSLQGDRDLDTGSFSNMSRNFYELHGRELTEKQARTIKELAGTVKDLNTKVAELTDKLTEAHDKPAKVQKAVAPQIQAKAKNLADKLRDNAKLNRPGMFSAATPASLVWDAAVEIVAKGIEGGGLLADAIAKGVQHIQASDWYKGLSDKEKQVAEEQFTDWHMEQADKKTAARIKNLEKQLANLQEGNVKTKGAPREETEREKELKEQIFDAKDKLGLIKSKSAPQPTTPITPQTLASRLVNKRDNVFSADDARDIWAHVKEKYLDKGLPLGDALRGTSTDLGLSPEQILHAIATPKGGKELTMELFKRQYERNKASNFAKRFVETANQSAAKKFWNSLPSRFFTLKTYGHGTVGNITHAATNIFRPSVWSAYWPNVIKSFGLAYGSPANYEKAVTLLESSPNFLEWKKAGLAVDPREAYDDYQVFGRPVKKTLAGKVFHYLGEAGTKGFTGLKMMRYDLAELWYNQASDTERADPNFRAEIAKLANHATGHSEVKVGKAIKALTFAPGLEVSRWQRMITDPAKAANTFLHWNKATPAEQAAAKIVASGAGQRLAVYSAALAANAGLLAALGSKQQINTADPSKSDWLKFKMNGKTLDITGGVLGPIRLLHTVGMEAYKAYHGDKKELRTKPNDKDAQTLWQQLRYKEAPLPADITDLATGQDAMGNTLPFSKVKPGKGRKQLGATDYAENVLLPIPIAAGFNAYQESMESQGVPASTTKAVWNGALTGLIEGFTGAKYQPDYSLEQEGGSGGGAGAAGRYARTGGRNR